MPVVDHGRRVVIDYKSETVRRILDAAEQIFSEYCFDGARMDEIAAVAGVNKATIYYHIGDKAKLYNVVLTRHFSRFADRLELAVTGCTNPLDGFRTVARLYAEEFVGNIYSTRTIAHEIAGGSSRMTLDIAAISARIFGVTARLVESGTASGILQQVDPFILHLFLSSPLFTFALANPLRPKVLAAMDGERPDLPSVEDMIKFLDTFLIPALCPPAQDTAP